MKAVLTWGSPEYQGQVTASIECYGLALKVFTPWAWVCQAIGCLDHASNNSHELSMPSFLVANVLSILQNLYMDCKTAGLFILQKVAHMPTWWIM